MRKTFTWASCIAVVVAMQSSLLAQKPKADPEQVFKKLDADKDGKLTFEEFLGKRTDEDGKFKKRFEMADKDKNGTVSLEEFKAVMSKGK